jgi:hypothetical protein
MIMVTNEDIFISISHFQIHLFSKIALVFLIEMSFCHANGKRCEKNLFSTKKTDLQGVVNEGDEKLSRINIT